MLKDNRTTPPAIVPPFKKRKENSNTEEENKHHFLTPVANRAAPSTKKHTISVMSNKPSEDSPPVTLADTADDELARSGSENPAAEAECVRGTLSRGKRAACRQSNKAHVS